MNNVLQQSSKYISLCEKLKKIQTNNYLKIRASMNDIPMEKQQKQNIVNMREIQNDYITGIITRTDYIRKMTYTNLPIAL